MMNVCVVLELTTGCTCSSIRSATSLEKLEEKFMEMEKPQEMSRKSCSVKMSSSRTSRCIKAKEIKEKTKLEELQTKMKFIEQALKTQKETKVSNLRKKLLAPKQIQRYVGASNSLI